jgi:hypothetical protein
VGDLFPAANVLGIDLSPIQPEWVPPNVRFMVDDVEYVFLVPSAYFSFPGDSSDHTAKKKEPMAAPAQLL